MKEMIVVIDDERMFSFQALYIRSSGVAVTMLRHNAPIQKLYLDHDLGEKDTIMPVVDYLCERSFNGNPYPVEQVFVHSQNPSGAEAMVRTLERYQYRVRRIPLPK